MCICRENTVQIASLIQSMLGALVSHCTQLSKVKTKAKVKKRSKHTTQTTTQTVHTSRSRRVARPKKRRERSRTVRSNSYRSYGSTTRKGKGGQWSAAEDRVLLEAFKNGPTHMHQGRRAPNWVEIAKKVPGRTSDQCMKRYSKIKHGIKSKKTPWTADEDRIILESVNTVVHTRATANGSSCVGRTNWAVIAKLLDEHAHVATFHLLSSY